MVAVGTSRLSIPTVLSCLSLPFEAHCWKSFAANFAAQKLSCLGFRMWRHLRLRQQVELLGIKIYYRLVRQGEAEPT